MSDRPLHQDARVDEPGLVGARWWQDSVVDPVGRRQAILMLLGVGAVLGVGGVAYEACKPGTVNGRSAALELQRKYGWSFGAATESLVFNGVSTEPFDPDRLGRMVEELAPRVAAHKPYYVPTLFEAPTALPQATAQGDPTPIPPLKSALKPILTSSMKAAFAFAQAALQPLATVGNAALVVDLDGPDAVAFAAGLAAAFDPVFLFDNWPHPKGVVPAHLTLAAAAYYQPMLASPPATSTQARDPAPMFVVDRQRLAPYVDSSEQFDNRWVARMPGVAALRSIGVQHLLYVAPSGTRTELDDLNDDFVTDQARGIAITILPVDFINQSSLGGSYVPVPRRTLFSSGTPGGGRPTPSEFGTVPIVLTATGATLLGIAWSRSGTWNRGWGG